MRQDKTAQNEKSTNYNELRGGENHDQNTQHTPKYTHGCIGNCLYSMFLCACSQKVTLQVHHFVNYIVSDEITFKGHALISCDMRRKKINTYGNNNRYESCIRMWTDAEADLMLQIIIRISL